MKRSDQYSSPRRKRGRAGKGRRASRCIEACRRKAGPLGLCSQHIAFLNETERREIKIGRMSGARAASLVRVRVREDVRACKVEAT